MNRLLILAMVVAILTAVALPVFADRIILTPSGATLATGRFRVEGAVQASETDNRRAWAAIGLPRFELEGERIETHAGLKQNVLNVEVSVLPQTLLTPAVGVGVFDAADDIERSFYGAVTKTVPFTDKLPLPIRDIRLTAGIGTGKLEGVFAGAEASVMGFRLQAEYDGDDVNAAIGLPILGLATAKALWIKDDFYVGVEVKPKF